MADEGDSDSGSYVRMQMQISDISSPELYEDLKETRVNSRRHRLAHLATLGLLFERSLLNGGMASVAEGIMKKGNSTVTSKRKLKNTHAAEPTPKTNAKPDAVPIDESRVLAIPSGFGSELLSAFEME